MLWLLLTLIAATFRGLADGLKKKVFQTIPLIDAIGAFTITQCIISIPVLLFNIEFFLSANLLVLIATLALLNFIASFFLGASYQTEEVSIIAPLFNLSPAFLLVLSFFLLAERPSFVQIIGVLIIVLGGYFLTTKNLKEWHHPFTTITPRHFFYMVVVLFIATFLAIINKVVLLGASVATAYFWYVVFNTVLYLGLLLFKQRLKSTLIAIKRFPKFFFIPTFFGTISLVLLYVIFAIPTSMVSLVIPILRISTVLTIIIGGTFMHEHNFAHKIVSSAIMLLGVFLIALS